MIVLTHINVPGDALEEMRTKYNMSPNDVKRAIQFYAEIILQMWDGEYITFAKFLENDMNGKHLFVNK